MRAVGVGKIDLFICSVWSTAIGQNSLQPQLRC